MYFLSLKINLCISLINVFKWCTKNMHLHIQIIMKIILFSRLEGNLYKYTNVMRGFQIRYFVVNTQNSKLDYFVVSFIFVLIL